MAKRLHELAREWGQSTKDVVACAERLGIHGKRAQSSLSDEEATRVKKSLGLTLDPTAGLSIGRERIVAERVVTERDSGAEQLVTAREKTTETRLQTNVIRRRRARQVLRREELPTPMPGTGDGSEGIPPSLDFDTAVPPSLTAAAPPPPPPPAEPVARTEAEPRESAPAVPASDPSMPVEAARSAPTPRPPVSAAPERPAPVRRPAQEPARTSQAPAARVPSAPAIPPGDQQHGVKVLGRIDLRKAAQPPPPPSGGGWRGTPEPLPPAGMPPPPAAPGSPRRRKGRRVVKKSEFGDTLERGRGRGAKRPQKRRALPGKEVKKTEITVPRASKRIIRISEVITVADLARAMGVKAGEVLKKLIDMGMMATINQALDHDTATLVAVEFEYQVENVAFDAEQALEAAQEISDGDVATRAPVVTMMGHVDHGKTSLLDAVRTTNVAAREAGGITQHIGAYTVGVRGRQITFLDTPGHAAFTAMRARGAQVTDIVVLVVAADDGVMPQTVEAINHARAAGVPIVVAINKIDKPDANVERVRQELSNHGLVPEEWGGDTTAIGVSAKTSEGIDQLLEMLLLQADVLELKANPNRQAKGVIIEARLDRGRGPVATVLVQEGTLVVGDSFVCGVEFGRLRAMMDDKGNRVKSAGPSMPVEILGIGGVPAAGDVLIAVQDEQKARQVAGHRANKQRDADMAKTAKVSLDDLYLQVKQGDVRDLKVVLKADVQGSVEAVTDALQRLSTDEVRLSVIHGSVGGITESDVLLASASNGVIIGFNVRPEPKAAALAEREGVDIRLYTIIYEALNELRDALEGLLEPTKKESVLGRAEVRNTFSVSGVGVIAGCFVTDGKLVRNAAARLLRDNVVVHEGRIGSLKRFKDDAREVQAGYECGAGLEGYSDVKVGDVIEAYEMIEVSRRLQSPARAAGAERPA